MVELENLFELGMRELEGIKDSFALFFGDVSFLGYTF
jgi:hypothetical protein